MTSRDFCYWLQGYFEVNEACLLEGPAYGSLTSGQVDCVRRHLAMVFAHEIDPSFGGPEKQQKLDALHVPGGPDVKFRC